MIHLTLAVGDFNVDILSDTVLGYLNLLSSFGFKSVLNESSSSDLGFPLSIDHILFEIYLYL